MNIADLRKVLESANVRVLVEDESFKVREVIEQDDEILILVYDENEDLL